MVYLLYILGGYIMFCVSQRIVDPDAEFWVHVVTGAVWPVIAIIVLVSDIFL